MMQVITTIKKIGCQFLLVTYFLFFYLASSCNSREQGKPIKKDFEVNQFEVVFKLGLKDQSLMYQLGDPVGVRTDNSGNIYIADRASLTIRIFDKHGNFINEIGRRGRGPGEFLDINTFEITPEGNFFILDRGNMSYTIINDQGELISNYPIDFSMEWQFYPDDIDFYKDKIVALFNDGVFIENRPIGEKKLFYIYDLEFNDKLDSFFSFSEIQDIEINNFTWVVFLGRPGSFVFNEKQNEFFYSPLIYHGNIYHFKRNDENWKLNQVIKMREFTRNSYTLMERSQLEKHKANNVPGLISMFYGGGPDPHMGRVNTFDAGIHRLRDGNIILFTAKWVDDLGKKGQHHQKVDIYAQIIDKMMNVKDVGYITSVETSRMPWKPLINWKDSEDYFYLLENTDMNYPSVTKFRLQSTELDDY